MTYAAALAGAVATVGLMLCAGQPWREGMPLTEWLGGAAPFMLWTLSPYVLTTWAARRLGRRSGGGVSSAAVALLTVVLGAVGVAAYVHTLFVAEPDAQSALIFLAVPFYQLLAALAAVLLGSRLRGRHSPATR